MPRHGFTELLRLIAGLRSPPAYAPIRRARWLYSHQLNNGRAPSNGASFGSDATE